MTWLILITIGILAGIISGMGIGGGTILIPALILFFGYEQQVAQNINLIYFIPTAAIALVTHKKNDNIDKTVLWKITVFGLLGAVVGSWIAIGIDAMVLKKIFGFFLLLMGLMEVFKKAPEKKR